MARKQSPKQQATVERVMHEFKHGELKMAGDGPKVKNPKQAIAIALREAGASDRQSPRKNAESLRRTKSKERRGATGKARAEAGRGAPRGRRASAEKTKAQLYAEARRKGIPGRSRMSKGQLQRALTR